ncbi:MAG: hypothetical protein KGO02_14650 [Alphaproteobacteria bacterium]|nr:hypothetical protein [Alphaproteobacteria bacterium]
MSALAAQEYPPFRLRLVPLLVVAALCIGIPMLAAICSAYTIKAAHLPIVPGDNVDWLYIQHGY